MTCDEIEHGYELYVFGTLEGEERARIEAGLQEHLARGCPTCTAGVAQARELAAHLALAAPPAEPPAGLRDQILKAVAPSGSAAILPETAPPGTAALWKWAFGLSALAAMALLILSLSLFQEARSLERELQTLQTSARSQRDRERELLKRLGAYREALRLITAPGAREVRFGRRQPSGRVFLQPQGLVMVASDLPQPPSGRTYELWLIAANRPAPIPAGVFAPDASGNAVHIWQQPIEVASVKAIAISDEPPGGVPAPTGKILLSAPVQ